MSTQARLEVQYLATAERIERLITARQALARTCAAGAPAAALLSLRELTQCAMDELDAPSKR